MTSQGMVACALLCVPILGGVFTARAGADLLLNEVLYDPVGADQGLEFVELWNPDTSAVSLAGIVLEGGDGASPGTWVPLYAGSAGDSVPAGSPYLIAGGSLIAPLQNGPDAVRLRRAGVVLDLLGYGALTGAGLFEGAPTPDVASGESLARVDDGRDTDSNAGDWAAEPNPTPGTANHPDVRLSLSRSGIGLAPEVPWPGEVVTLRATVWNLGRLAVPAERWRLEVSVRRGAGGDSSWPAPATIGPGRAIASGDSAVLESTFLAPAAGRFDLRSLLRDLDAPSGGTDRTGRAGAIADTAFLSSRSEVGPLEVHEYAFRDRGAGEWIELLAREAVSDVGAFTLSDAEGRPCAIDRGASPRSLPAGELLVIAESPERVRSAYALPESLVIGCSGGWPALNDTDGEDGLADRVRLLDRSGIPSDAVPYRASYSARGSSIERLGPSLPSASPGAWAESIDPSGGTPGRPNSMHVGAVLVRGGDALLYAETPAVRRVPGSAVVPAILQLTENARGRRLRVLVHDLLGRPRRLLIDGQRVLGEGAFLWDGRDDRGEPVAPGIYVVRAETLPDGGEPARSASLALRVVEGRP